MESIIFMALLNVLTKKKSMNADRLFADCISFVLMQEEGLSDALTMDHHFEQAGFRIMLIKQS